MLRSNKTAASVLQKTYDESYLTCSTAVYYESQGNEAEAMRCWKLALDRIYDHHANRTLPNFTPSSETEKALADSLRQLELQCKERIDLLEALRLSRQDMPSGYTAVGGQPGRSSTALHQNESQGKGWIGGGTIPAVEYTELSRPPLPKRPSVSSKASLERIKDRTSRIHLEEPEAAISSNLPSLPFPAPALDGQLSRRTSPERHIMRTTLRGNRSGDKSSSSTPKRTPSKLLDGPGASKAASLAWSALSQGDKAGQSQNSSQPSSQPSSTLPSPSERPRRSLDTSLRQWDSHSRRLVTPRKGSPIKDSDAKTSLERAFEDIRQADYSPPSAKLQTLSISAAASAINSLSLKDNAKRPSGDTERSNRQKATHPLTPRANVIRREQEVEVGGYSADSPYGPLGRKTSSESAIISRKTVGHAGSTGKGNVTPTKQTKSDEKIRTVSERRRVQGRSSSSSLDETAPEARAKPNRRSNREVQKHTPILDDPLMPTSESSAEDEGTRAADTWRKRKAKLLKGLPAGVDEHAAKQILNEIVVQGDEVHWTDIAGLEIAKNALRETVVYPFLRPDLFMGLREPARGMLLFGPPGTGKTMLARAVATESKSTFFSISASSLTSKYLGESEKLVRALFVLAKLLAPSIIFVDEIDSLLSKRSGSGEHEATRRIKTEFLIQWSDLQRAAAGREVGEREKERGDANRVLVLAATNLPWVIDEAARRRFVRRQYIPLPEAETRAVQIKTLLGQQKHTLTNEDIETLVGLTDGKLLLPCLRLLPSRRGSNARQDSLARMSQPWRRTRPWVRSGHLVKHFYT